MDRFSLKKTYRFAKVNLLCIVRSRIRFIILYMKSEDTNLKITFTKGTTKENGKKQNKQLMKIFITFMRLFTSKFSIKKQRIIIFWMITTMWIFRSEERRVGKGGRAACSL